LRVLGLALVLSSVLQCAAGDNIDPIVDCFSEDNERRIKGCSAVIERGNQTLADMSHVHAMRGLAYSLKGRYEEAIRDYNVAIDMKPDFAVALNNRAWAYFRWGKSEMGLADVERSMQLSPTSPNTFDTRAHIYQNLGRLDEALHDYDQAMLYGGSRIVKVYQCGLKDAHIYMGEIDGNVHPELSQALERCVHDKGCDPLPVDERCH
jgi:tetratricopeptide (TPR) repeat protein